MIRIRRRKAPVDENFSAINDVVPQNLAVGNDEKQFGRALEVVQYEVKDGIMNKGLDEDKDEQGEYFKPQFHGSVWHLIL